MILQIQIVDLPTNVSILALTIFIKVWPNYWSRCLTNKESTYIYRGNDSGSLNNLLSFRLRFTNDIVFAMQHRLLKEIQLNITQSSMWHGLNLKILGMKNIYIVHWRSTWELFVHNSVGKLWMWKQAQEYLYVKCFVKFVKCNVFIKRN